MLYACRERELAMDVLCTSLHVVVLGRGRRDCRVASASLPTPTGLSAAVRENGESRSELEAEQKRILKDMAELKATLYGKFGNAINLEE